MVLVLPPEGTSLTTVEQRLAGRGLAWLDGDMNEEGTEAAAATAVVVNGVTCVREPLRFRCDRPFLFLIRHEATKACLFIGRRVNPVE